MDAMPWSLMLRRRWALVAAFTLAGFAAAAAYVLTAAPSYASSTTLFFSPSSGSTASELNQGTAYTQNLVKSFAQVATSERVLSPVVRELDLETTPARLSRRVTAQTAPDSLLLTIAVVDPDPQQAARTADAVGEQLIDVVADLSPVSRTAGRTIKVTVVAEAQVPESPASRAELALAAGPLLGLLLGLGLAGLLELIGDKVRTTKQVRDVTGLEVLGILEGPGERAPGAAAVPSEAVRRLRTNLLAALRRQGHTSVLLTEPSRGTASAGAAIDLATGLVEAGLRTLLVDADLRRSAVTSRLGLSAAPGLHEVVRGSASARTAVRACGEPGLMVLTAGSPTRDPGEVLASPRLAALLAEVEESFDVVLVHSAPVLPDADAGVLSTQVQATLVVVDSRSTTRGELRRAMAALQLADAQLIGVVIAGAGGEEAAPPGVRPAEVVSDDRALPARAAPGTPARRRADGAGPRKGSATEVSVGDPRTAPAARNG